MHVHELGPGDYHLPPLVAVEKHVLSSNRNSPRVSLGLPTDRNKPYHKENYTEFMGRDSPSLSSYKP